MSLTTIRDLSNRYGADPSFVLAGGGNTSYKDEKYLYVKPSGVALAEIRESDFVRMERETIRKVFSLSGYADNVEREAMVTKLMAFAAADSAARRPSVEAPLHELMPFTYIVHLHPAMVNGLTCSKNGKKECGRLFPDALWIPETDPGFILAKTVYDASVQYEKEHGKPVSMIFLQNHGVFVGGNTAQEIDAAYGRIMSTLREAYEKAGIPTRPSIAITRSRASFFDIFRCRNSTSDSWPPIVCTGESAVIGSWKIIAMRLPRIS